MPEKVTTYCNIIISLGVKIDYAGYLINKNIQIQLRVLVLLVIVGFLLRLIGSDLHYRQTIRLDLHLHYRFM